MATLILSATGAVVGGATFGVAGATVGRFAGAALGYVIDQRIMGQGAEVVETGHTQSLRLTGSGEGLPVARGFGRTRVAGHVIWASQFKERVKTHDVDSGGKGSRREQPKQRSYHYSISLAIALCEGEITHVARIWADAEEIPRDSLALRLYRGTEDQSPDPRMEAIEGTGQVPAYRGTAYVVIEDLDLGRFGNRVPHFTFEVCRPSQPDAPGAADDPAHGISGVALLPGSGEYALATTPVAVSGAGGRSQLVNVNSPADKADMLTSLDDLNGELPNCRAASLVVSWFGDDLRAGSCEVRPMVEQKDRDGTSMPWMVGDLRRAQAVAVPRDQDNAPVYGGTPTDQSVIQAIRALRDAGKEVMFYPFVLMTQMQGNALPDPYSDAEGQPVLPWRGRITLDQAPGRPGSADGTAQAVADVEAFFGSAQVAHFAPPLPQEPDSPTADSDGLSFLIPQLQEPSLVSYSGPAEWRYRRFILHNAMLCKLAGGVESFCIGSELRGVTQIRGPENSFPAVAALRQLAADVRSLLGPEVKITYAADWSEYFGYHPGGGACFFHLDPLWADENIDFIGIDNYMPLSDWRATAEHADAHWGSIYNLDYLKANVQGGEGYDWFYHSPEARAAQIRTPITDQGEAEPWIWRYKDIRNWWSEPHYDRPDGVRAKVPTAWKPRSKPIRFTEYGCAAIDKGTNQPNKFLDPKSSESQLPLYSNGHRDELMQMQYLRAIHGYWRDPQHNPVSELYQGPMIDMDHACVWAWDLRPYPHFPASQDIWRDGDNYARGHWLNGRVSGRSLASVLSEVTAAAGVGPVDVSQAFGFVRGYDVSEITDARTALQPLLLAYGVDASERSGTLVFRNRDGVAQAELDPAQLVRDRDQAAVTERTQDAALEIPGRVRLRFVQADADYAVIAEEAALHDSGSHRVSGSEMSLVLTRSEGRQIVTRWLAETRLSAETVRFGLPGSLSHLGPGDVVRLPDQDQGARSYRIDRADQAGLVQQIEAVRIDPSAYEPIEIADDHVRLSAFRSSAPVMAQLLDVPLLSSQDVAHAPYLASYAEPWPGQVAVYMSEQDAGYRLLHQSRHATSLGMLESELAPARPDLADKGPGMVVRMWHGSLSSIAESALFAGDNLALISDGSQELCEIIQFRDAELIGPETYRLSYLLRGLRGTEFVRPDPWPAGSFLMLPGPGLTQLPVSTDQRGVPWHFRIGPAQQTPDHTSYRHFVTSFSGHGLRPYAPVHLRTQTVDGGGLRLSWIRRTRLDGDRWNTPEIPLNEESERYLVRVSQGGVMIRESFVSAPEWIYTTAAQQADAVSGAVDLAVAQVSASYGPGRFAQVAVGL